MDFKKLNMKNIVLLIFACAMATGIQAQDFDKNLASARSSYSSGNLADARFAMEQLLSDLDVAIGKEILKVLPTSVGTLNANPKEDVVNSGGGATTGLFVHRSFGIHPKQATIDIINNSPMINSINAILNTPIIGGMMHNDNQKVVRIQGYKSILQKDGDGDKTSYELQIPFNNSLLTFKLEDTSEDEITQFANAIPLSKIAQTAQ